MGFPAENFMTVFLDIDGVLNKESDWRIPFTLNPECVKEFASFVQKLDRPRIILTSTWRAGISVKGNNSPQYDKLVETLYEYRLVISGATPLTSNKTRDEEIDYYARRNGISDYIAIDDDPGLFKGGKNVPLYVTDYRTGFTKEDIKKALKMIKRR